MSSLKHCVVIAATLGALHATVAAAQCHPPANTHEARLLAFYEVPAVFTMGTAPEILRAGEVRVGAEAVPVPSPSATLTHPEYCYQYTTNNTKLASVFGRPRISIGLPASFMLEASYLPPISLMNARATMGSVALSRIQALSIVDPRLALLVRAHGTLGRVSGPITCPRGSLQLNDAGAPCYGTAPSLDHFDPNSLGAEGALGATAGQLALYLGGGVSWVRPHFQAGFTDALGNVDHTTVDVGLVRGVAFGGASFHLREDIELSGQVYAVPADATTLRIGIDYRIR